MNRFSIYEDGMVPMMGQAGVVDVEESDESDKSAAGGPVPSASGAPPAPKVRSDFSESWLFVDQRTE